MPECKVCTPGHMVGMSQVSVHMSLHSKFEMFHWHAQIQWCRCCLYWRVLLQPLHTSPTPIISQTVFCAAMCLNLSLCCKKRCIVITGKTEGSTSFFCFVFLSFAMFFSPWWICRPLVKQVDVAQGFFYEQTSIKKTPDSSLVNCSFRLLKFA